MEGRRIPFHHVDVTAQEREAVLEGPGIARFEDLHGGDCTRAEIRGAMNS